MKPISASKCIVVGVDASDESDTALREALRTIAVMPRAEMHLVHAARPYVLPPMTMAEPAGYQAGRAHADMLRRLPQQYWQKAVRLAREEHVVPETDEIDVHVRVGAAPDAILQVAEEVGADLVIVGCHGRTGLRRAVLGSVAERVVRDAKCPVMVARLSGYSPKSDTSDERPPDTDRELSDQALSFRRRQRVNWSQDNPDNPGLAS